KLRFFSYRLKDTLKPNAIWQDIQDLSPKSPGSLENPSSGQTKHWSGKITLQGNTERQGAVESNQNTLFSCSKSKRRNILTVCWSASLQICLLKLHRSKVLPGRFSLNC